MGEVIRPYLELPARLSQVWLNRWTLLFFLILAHLISIHASLQSDIENAKQEALAACLTLEKTGSILASLPHFAAHGLNALTSKGIEASVSALGTTINLMLTGVEELVLFIINSYKNTYLCLITLAVRGSLGAVVDAAEDTVNFLNSTLSTIEHNILSDAAAAQNTILNSVNGIVGGISGAIGLGTLNIPPITIPAASQLLNVTIPTTVSTALENLNNSIPTFDQVKNATDSAVQFPFDLLKEDVSSTLSNFSFNSSLLPVPALEQLQFCSSNVDFNNFFDALLDAVRHVLVILIALTVLAAVLAMVPYAILEWWQWRKLKRHAQLASTTLSSSERTDHIELLQILASPLTYKITSFITKNINSPRQKALIRWYFAYITHPPALLVLAVSVATFLSCLLQLALLRQIQTSAPEFLADISSFENEISLKIQNATASWILGTNARISQVEQSINDNMLGWAQGGTQSLNNTLNTFVETTVTTLQAAFNNTPLEAPVLDVVNCVILMKVADVQKGLTFVNEHARVTFPRVNESMLEIQTGDLSQSLSNGSSVGDTSVSTIVTNLIDKWQSAIRQEALVGAVLLAVYLCVVIMGLLRVVYLRREVPRIRGEGGSSDQGIHGMTFIRAKIWPQRDARYDKEMYFAGPGPTPSGGIVD